MKETGLSRRHNIAAWIAAGLVAALLTMTGLSKFLLHEAEVQAFARWGYPAWFVTVVGTGELFVAAFILVPRTATYAAGLGIALMLGAIATHLRVPELGLIPLATLVAVLCGTVGWLRRGQRWKPEAP